jgi:NtrC-family two-component system response regulator AlgB
MNAPLRVLVVDDAPNLQTLLGRPLETLGCTAAFAASADDALDALAQERFDLAFVGLHLAADSGLDLLPRLLAQAPDLGVVIITSHASVDSAVEAMKRGARDYLQKPFAEAQIRQIVERERARRPLLRRLSNLESQLRDAAPEVELESAAPGMRAALDLLERAAGSDVAVLLRGESGTGKSVLARFLHARSARATGPFVVVSCPTLSEELLASELFGHARGSFTGAVRDQPGRVELAEGGTLFLDEIGDMPPNLQAKLLRFLQEKQFERLGEARTREADVRVVAATHHDLESEVAAGRFREDLFYRLNVVEVALPPLRERPDDVLRLARRFVAFFARSVRRAPPEMPPATEALLLAYAWPGNVRELRNAIERAVMLWPGPRLEPAALPARVLGDHHREPQIGADLTLEALEREHIERVLARCPTLEAAASVLGIDDSTLWRKRKRFGV